MSTNMMVLQITYVKEDIIALAGLQSIMKSMEAPKAIFNGRSFDVTIKIDISTQLTNITEYIIKNKKLILFAHLYSNPENIYSSNTSFFSFENKRFMELDKQHLKLRVIYKNNPSMKDDIRLYNNNGLYKDVQTIIINAIGLDNSPVFYAIYDSIQDDTNALEYDLYEDARSLYDLVNSL